MFRTLRGFLFVAPLGFLTALGTFLLTHPQAADGYAVYPFLVEPFGPGLVKRPFGRFGMTSLLAFLLPYLTTALLLFLADIGAGAAAALWRKTPRKARPKLSPESLWSFVVTVLVASAVAGFSLHKVAHGGELPGGVNVAPIFVAAIPYLAIVVALVVSALASIPRAVHRRLEASRASV